MRKLDHERRRQKRFVKRCTIEFTSDGQTYRGICRNLSLDGLFIKTRKLLPLEKTIEMIVDLPDGSTSKLTGRITRETRERYSLIFERAGIPSKDGIGIQLIKKDANYLKFLASLITRL
ncbi:MAG TPA: PilZ domain-containing protein [Syntrophales bacterium]|nr:PilZ domain-containing protein [Syntrophales bacterium]